ncbi:DUF1007 family protein [Pseudoruegeria sp. HB172150]|uniref:DUF1007 family protein n=1 Tax=Pseudoruegeria sp. HB172150 TaxID=2721164 RepID=UPI00155399C5|nr:DUF1007 family protein [Pseudoruegeria sp. HB172150]
MTSPALPACLIAVASAVVPFGASAHPHIFIDTAFRFVFDEAGLLTAVAIDWTYDDFYSLLMIEENELDSDGDGTPEQDRLDAFAGHDVDWEAGYPGDFTVEWKGEAVPLSGPIEHEAHYDNGRITTSHTRMLSPAFDPKADSVVARSYDPTYFVAYEVPTEPGIVGRDDCRIVRDAADKAKAQQEYGDQLAAIDVTGDPFEVVEVPDIGVLFADAFTLLCNAGS